MTRIRWREAHAPAEKAARALWGVALLGLASHACANMSGGTASADGGSFAPKNEAASPADQPSAGPTDRDRDPERDAADVRSDGSGSAERSPADSAANEPKDGALDRRADVPMVADGAAEAGLRFTFQAISDTHISANKYPDFTQHFIDLLQEVATIDPTSSALVISGDITELGSEADYDAFVSLMKANPHPPTYYAIGNHDVRGQPGGYAEAVARFKAKTGMPGVYHDRWISDHHFIFIGTEQDLKDDAFLSATQLKWLRERLADRASPGKPIFLFCHQAIPGTVAKGNGILQGTELKALLAEYPQTVFITAHSHSPVETPGNLFNQQQGIMVNDGASAYVGGDRSRSEGLFLAVYGDRIEIRGRDFQAKKWVWNATVKLPVK